MASLLLLRKSWIAYLIFFWVLVTNYHVLRAQIEIGTAQYPPGLDWQTIRTSHFSVIFPSSLESEGQRIACLLEHTYRHITASMPGRFRYLPVIIGNQSVIPNGYVTLAPWKSEFLRTPPQSLFIGDWYHTLAVHEMRHAAQFTFLNHGLVRLGKWAFGDAGHAVFSILAAPAWFWEGDAVMVETALTRGGRGRSPWFDLGLRVPILERETWSYEKAYFRSFNEYIPDHYTLGYHMVTYLRRHYGKEVWNHVLHQSSWLYFGPFTFSSALKKCTGHSLRQTYHMAMAELDSIWTLQAMLSRPVPVNHIPIRHTCRWDNYLYPQPQTDGSIIALRTGLDTPPTLVRVQPDGKTEPLLQIAPLDAISARGGYVVWNSVVPDLRWGNRNYADIFLYDLATKQKRRITHHRKLFSPALSSDGHCIAAVELGPTGNSRLVIMDTRTGSPLHYFAPPDSAFLMTPAWSSNMGQIVCLLQNASGRALAVIDTTAGTFRTITPFRYEEIAHPQLNGEYIIYQTPISGYENIHLLNIHTREQHSLTARPYAAMHPMLSPDGTRLWFNDYTRNGQTIAWILFAPSRTLPVEPLPVRENYIAPIVDQEQTRPIFLTDSLRFSQHEVKQYSAWQHLLNFHSWLLLPATPLYTFRIISTDLLNTMQLAPGMEYNSQEKTIGYFANIQYAGLFPVFDATLRYGGRTSTFEDSSSTHYYTWNERSIDAGIKLPFNLSMGPNIARLTLSARISCTDISNRQVWFAYDNNDGRLTSMQYQISFSKVRTAAYRDFRPRLGIQISAVHERSFPSSNYRGAQTAVSGRIYLPGLIKHHSLMLNGFFARQEVDNYIFSQRFRFPRGYDEVFYSRLAGGSFNYAFPVLYPDFHAGPLIYFKRIKANLFLDYATGQQDTFRESWSSIGGELSFDVFPFQLPARVDIGVRLSYRLNDRTKRVEPVLFGAYAW